jgi:hypothetical protein
MSGFDLTKPSAKINFTIFVVGEFLFCSHHI